MKLRLVGAALSLGLAGCGPTLPDGPSHLPVNADVPLAMGTHRLLFQMDPTKRYRVGLRPGEGAAAVLAVAVCKLDWHWRVDDGDSHCLGQEVAVSADGQSEAAPGLPEAKPPGAQWGLALRIFAEGTGPAPLLLRVDTE